MTHVYGAMDRAALEAELIRDEGVRLFPYLDTVNKLSIGVGRNLTDVGISRDEASYLLNNDIDKAIKQVATALPWWAGLDDVRKRVLVNMSFNLGITGLLTFENTLAAIRDGRWQDAHDGMLKSKWATQVGMRATRLAEAMLTGEA